MTKRSLMTSLLAIPLMFLMYTSQAAGGWMDGGRHLASALDEIQSAFPATITGLPPIRVDESETAAPPEPRTHIIQPGETLHSIAAQYGVTVEALVKINEIPNANRIWVGQMLIIPDGSGLSAAQQPMGTGLLPGDQVTMYTVQPGDTMNGLADRFGIPVQQLAADNDIPNANRLYAGQVLAIPTALLDSALLVTANPAPMVAEAPPPTETQQQPATPPVVVIAPSAQAAAPPSAGAGDQVYLVEAGDTLSAIAFHNETSVAVLAAANSIADPDYLFIGQRLIVSGPTLAEVAQKLAMGGLIGPYPGETVEADVAAGSTLK